MRHWTGHTYLRYGHLMSVDVVLYNNLNRASNIAAHDGSVCQCKEMRRQHLALCVLEGVCLLPLWWWRNVVLLVLV